MTEATAINREALLDQLEDLSRQVYLEDLTVDDAQALLSIMRMVHARIAAENRPAAPVFQLVAAADEIGGAR